MTIIAVVGLSAVGKSTLIARVSTDVEFIHLQASRLIKDEQQFQGALASTSEELRLGDVRANQQLLISGFRRAAAGHKGLIVFDGHTVIDGSDGLVEIPTAVFQKIGCNAMAVIQDAPATILYRRQSDTVRSRPVRSISEINDHQLRSLSAAQRISRDLKIPLSLFEAGDIEEFRIFLKGLRAGRKLA